MNDAPEFVRVLSRSPLASLGAAAGAELPRRMMILRWGENPNANGKTVRVGQRLLDALADPDCPFSEVALDFEHNTVPGTPEYQHTAEPRAVAGYGRIVAEEGVGVFLEMERWTPEGEKMAHHYQDLSAAPVCDKAGNVVAIASVALCRTGAVPGITFSPSPLSSQPQPNTQQETQTMDFKAILIRLLGLPEDASDGAIAKAAEEKQQKPAQPAAPEPEGGVAPLAARIDALERRADEAEKAAILEKARAEGKVVALAADALAALTPAQLRETVEKTPATVPLSAVTPAAVKEPAAKARPSEQQERIYALCGMTAEEVEKWA